MGADYECLFPCLRESVANVRICTGWLLSSIRTRLMSEKLYDTIFPAYNVRQPANEAGGSDTSAS